MKEIYTNAKTLGSLGGVNRMAKAARLRRKKALEFKQVHRLQKPKTEILEEQNNNDKLTATISN